MQRSGHARFAAAALAVQQYGTRRLGGGTPLQIEQQAQPGQQAQHRHRLTDQVRQSGMPRAELLVVSQQLALPLLDEGALQRCGQGAVRDRPRQQLRTAGDRFLLPSAATAQTQNRQQWQTAGRTQVPQLATRAHAAEVDDDGVALDCDRCRGAGIGDPRRVHIAALEAPLQIARQNLVSADEHHAAPPSACKGSRRRFARRLCVVQRAVVRSLVVGHSDRARRGRILLSVVLRLSDRVTAAGPNTRLSV